MTELELLREELRFKDEKIAFLEMRLAEPSKSRRRRSTDIPGGPDITDAPVTAPQDRTYIDPGFPPQHAPVTPGWNERLAKTIVA